MSWSKLDNDLAADDMPYSALLADGLTRNVNSYPNLNGASSICWLATEPVTWASYGQAMGTVVTLDVGVNCGRIAFNVNYQTATANGDGLGNCGRFFVRHLTSARQSSVLVTPSTVADTFSIALQFDAVSNYPAGPQAFFIGFQSHVLEERGSVEIQYGSRNQVILSSSGGSYVFSSGEKYELLTVGDEYKYAVEPDGLGRYAYQIGYASVVDEGERFVIWPELDNSPAIMQTAPSSGPTVYGFVNELGAFGLISLSYEVFAAPARNLRQLAHAPAVSLNSLSLDQSLAALDVRPDVAANATESRLGYRLQSEDDEISGIFAMQSKTNARLSISFRAVRLSDDGEDADWSLKVLDKTGALLTPEVVLSRVLIPRMSYQAALAASPVSMRVIEGARRRPRSWGMRDSMPLTDTLKGAPVLIETADFDLLPVATGGASATFRLTVSSGEFYLYGFSARFI